MDIDKIIYFLKDIEKRVSGASKNESKQNRFDI